MGSASTLDTSAPISELVSEGATTSTPEVLQWVAEVAELTQPSAVVWCDGSQDEWARITSEMVDAGTLISLNKDLRPGSFLARSHPATLPGSRIVPSSAARTKQRLAPRTTGALPLR